MAARWAVGAAFMRTSWPPDAAQVALAGTRSGVTRATPGVVPTAASIPRTAAVPVPPGGSLAAMISGASKPGPKPSAVVW